MKTSLALGMLTALLLSPNTNLSAAARDAQWQKVDNALQQGLPQAAITELESIIASALADEAYAEAIKAIGSKIALEGNIQGNKPEEKIVRLQSELEEAPAAMKPVMEAILSRWYWQYFQQNRWRFHQRTQTAEALGPDLQTWDLARILTEIDTHFTAALADEATLQATPVNDYDYLLESGSAPDEYRPTLFDFLVYDALEFYTVGEQGAIEAEDAFELDAEATPIFADAGEFVRWKPAASDGESPPSPLLKAVRLYQKLLQFHAADRNRSAFHDADLARLVFGHNKAVGEDKDARYRAALERFAVATHRHEISARAFARLAEHLHASGESVQARVRARRGLNAFPDSAGAAQCSNLIEQIEAKSLRLETERVWNAPWPTLNVTYRNITKVHFRAVRMSFEECVTRLRWGPDVYLERNERHRLLAERPVLAWDATLPATRDYRERTERVPAPTSLPPGFYFVIASHDPAFREDSDNFMCVVPVWVSELALVTQMQTDGRRHSGFVLQARSGEPIAGATVRIFEQNRDGWFREDAPTHTDADGRFEFDSRDRQIVLLVEHGGQAVSTNDEIYAYQDDAGDRDDTMTVFFTDRALYRPGQTIHYKGVSIRYDQDAGKYAVLPNLKLTVVFNDRNGQEIACAEQRTNDYGSFHGTFSAPRDRLMGRMTIRVLGRPSHTAFNVEEYKRPKFQVELPPAAEAVKLDEPVRIIGKATAYTGAPVSGAKVKWRVERRVQLPLWCWWWRPPASQAIAHGTATTETDGTFAIEFPATPDRSVPAKNEPIFAYTIHADVTDITGETRSDERIVRAGYTALQATIDAAEWPTPEAPVELAVNTRSLDGDPEPARGTLTVHALQQPAAVVRAPLQRERSWWNRADAEPPADPSNPDSWALGAVVTARAFATDTSGATTLSVPLAAGVYRVSVETQDRFGTTVTARRVVHVIDPDARHYGVKLPNLVTAPRWSVEPGDAFTALWGTGYDTGRAFVELECNGELLQRFWTANDRTQQRIEQAVTESMRGGLTLRVTYVRENRAYLHERIVDVPWSNKKLNVRWESFRSKLLPGQKETWKLFITGPDVQCAAAEMVAAMYDASLDQYQPHQWPHRFWVFRREYRRAFRQFQNVKRDFQVMLNRWHVGSKLFDWSYRQYPDEITANFLGYGFPHARTLAALPQASPPGAASSVFMVSAEADGGYRAASTLAGTSLHVVTQQYTDGSPVAREPSRADLSKITARRNLNETAFFFPELRSGADGEVTLEFTMPEALTEWKFLGFAHDQALRAGAITEKVVTSKDLMVEPNPPRFIREGDALEFTVKVSNQSDVAQNGKVQLTFADAATLASVDSALGNLAPEQPFDVPAKQSRSFSWRIAVPDAMVPPCGMTYKAVGASATVSDGEEGFLPVLSRRILVTESLPLPIRGKTTKQFAFTKLLESGKSDTLRHESLTVQMVSQPAWYAVMALPYLMEFPYECSEQIFNRYYANTLARHVANANPKIRRVFDLWRNTPALDSPLEKNEDLKSVLLEETPWVREARDESAARRNVGLLFDENRLDEETARTLRKLADQQLGDGRWSWFPGGPPNDFITLYITTGFGRLRHLGATIDVAPAHRALDALDAWMDERYQQIRKEPKPDDYVPDHIDAIYLYGRSFFIGDKPVAIAHREAVNFFIRQARKFWLRTDCRMCQAQIAVALQRLGDADTPRAILRSLKERSVTNEELGRFWRDTESSWWWYRAPIETQAMMIEAFAEVARDAEAVEDCKVWLLKQKQTQNWKTTKATADAVYALLLRGENLLASDALVEVSLGGDLKSQLSNLKSQMAGTGFYEERFVRGEIKPAMGEITVRKVDDGVSWGSVHWQYLEDMTKVTPHEGTPLRLKKTLFVKETTNKGPVLKRVASALAVGDELVVRIELRTDRDMEYVHLKDQRGAGTEPVNVLSRYKYQDGLAYYESTRDTASHFFIDYLPKGTYVFEYTTRVQHRGAYQSGIAEIQCMYAPEFNSHSESLTIEVR